MIHVAHYLPRCVGALARAEWPSTCRVSTNEPIAHPISYQLIGVLLTRLGKTALLVGMLDIRNAGVRLTEGSRIYDCPVTVVPAVACGCSRRDYLAIEWRDRVAMVIGGTAGPARRMQ